MRHVCGRNLSVNDLDACILTFMHTYISKYKQHIYIYIYIYTLYISITV